MDKETLKTTYNYNQIWEQHFNGGYFSEEVKKSFEAIQGQSDEEKREYYAQQFNEAFSLAEALKSHVGADSIDLSEQGLGVIDFGTLVEDFNEAEDTIGYRGVYARSTSFDPQIEGSLVYTNPDSLEDNSQHIATAGKHPKLWEWSEGWLYLEDSGRVDDESCPDGIDNTILWLLDTKETLEVAAQTLHRVRSF